MALPIATTERSSPLTPRQREVLRLQAYGFSHREISEHLGLSIWTVKNHHKQAVRSLQRVLTVSPSDRVRTSLACYVMGMLDAGISAAEIVRHLRDATPEGPRTKVATAAPDAGKGISRRTGRDEQTPKESRILATD